MSVQNHVVNVIQEHIQVAQIFKIFVLFALMGKVLTLVLVFVVVEVVTPLWVLQLAPLVLSVIFLISLKISAKWFLTYIFLIRYIFCCRVIELYKLSYRKILYSGII